MYEKFEILQQFNSLFVSAAYLRSTIVIPEILCFKQLEIQNPVAVKNSSVYIIVYGRETNEGCSCLLNYRTCIALLHFHL